MRERDSPAWSADELRRLSDDQRIKVLGLTDLCQTHLSEFDGRAWR